MGDLLREQDTVAAKDTLYRCLDLLVGHKEALFSHLSQRWQDLFGLKFEVLLYDLTSTYFEADPDPERGEEDKRRYGYSRDKLALTAKKIACALSHAPLRVNLFTNAPRSREDKIVNNCATSGLSRNGLCNATARCNDKTGTNPFTQIE